MKRSSHTRDLDEEFAKRAKREVARALANAKKSAPDVDADLVAIQDVKSCADGMSALALHRSLFGTSLQQQEQGLELKLQQQPQQQQQQQQEHALRHSFVEAWKELIVGYADVGMPLRKFGRTCYERFRVLESAGITEAMRTRLSAIRLTQQQQQQQQQHDFSLLPRALMSHILTFLNMREVFRLQLVSFPVMAAVRACGPYFVEATDRWACAYETRRRQPVVSVYQYTADVRGFERYIANRGLQVVETAQRGIHLFGTAPHNAYRRLCNWFTRCLEVENGATCTGQGDICGDESATNYLGSFSRDIVSSICDTHERMLHELPAILWGVCCSRTWDALRHRGHQCAYVDSTCGLPERSRKLAFRKQWFGLPHLSIRGVTKEELFAECGDTKTGRLEAQNLCDGIASYDYGYPGDRDITLLGWFVCVPPVLRTRLEELIRPLEQRRLADLAASVSWARVRTSQGISRLLVHAAETFVLKGKTGCVPTWLWTDADVEASLAWFRSELVPLLAALESDEKTDCKYEVQCMREDLMGEDARWVLHDGNVQVWHHRRHEIETCAQEGFHGSPRLLCMPTRTQTELVIRCMLTASPSALTLVKRAVRDTVLRAAARRSEQNLLSW